MSVESITIPLLIRPAATGRLFFVPDMLGLVGWSEVIAIAALLIAMAAGAVSLRDLRYQRVSSEAATRSAEAAERSNRLTERLLERETLIAPAPAEQSADVSWRIERPGKNSFVLRNTGTATADNVVIDPESAAAISRNLPRGAVARPGEGLEFLMMGALGRPIPNQVWVSWRGQEEPAAVAVPR